MGGGGEGRRGFTILRYFLVKKAYERFGRPNTLRKWHCDRGRFDCEKTKNGAF